VLAENSICTKTELVRRQISFRVNRTELATMEIARDRHADLLGRLLSGKYFHHARSSDKHKFQ
jgi:hypothetical protein